MIKLTKLREVDPICGSLLAPNGEPFYLTTGGYSPAISAKAGTAYASAWQMFLLCVLVLRLIQLN